MAGRNSGQYLASHPSRYRSNQRHTPSNRNYQSNFGSGTVADTGVAPRGEYFVKGPFLPNASTYSSNTTSRQPREADSQFQESNPKIEELRLLLAHYASQEDARQILEWAKIGLRKGDERLLTDKLQQLRARARLETLFRIEVGQTSKNMTFDIDKSEGTLCILSRTSSAPITSK